VSNCEILLSYPLVGEYIQRGVGVLRDQSLQLEEVEIKLEEVKVTHTLGGVGE
jgi:hypothetical protein